MHREMERGIEWNCQKTWRQYYHHVDHHEFEKAVELYTEDGIDAPIDRQVLSMSAKGCTSVQGEERVREEGGRVLGRRSA